jgi:two-component system, chemotaxis family, sensor kinase Cph1
MWADEQLVPMKIPPSIRTTVPVLLLLFGVAFSLGEYFLLLNANTKRAQQSVAELARSQAARLSGLAIPTIKTEKERLLENDLGYLDEDPELKFAFICDTDFRLINASSSEWDGRQLETTPAAYVREVLETVVKTSKAVEKVIADREVVIAARPRRTQGELARIALVVRDTSNPLGEARQNALLDTLRTSGFLFASLVALWFAFYAAVTRRLTALVRSAVAKDANSKPILGTDEIHEISRSIDQANAKLLQQGSTLQQSEARYANLVDTLPAVLVISRNERIEFINPCGINLFGARDRSELVGRSIHQLIHPDDLTFVRRQIEQTLESGKAPPASERKFVRLDGSILHVELSASNYPDQDGAAIQLVATDISERVEGAAMREALSRDLEEKHKELETVLYVASHDLRSPLVNVMGFSRQLSNACTRLEALTDEAVAASPAMAEMEPLVKTTIPRALRFIEQGVAKMDALLAGFLRFSRLGNAAMELRPVDMNTTVKSILGAMTYQIQQSNADVRVADLPFCMGDATQINQVFTNLIDNAIKYRRQDRGCVISIEGRVNGETVAYSITDNGIGIAHAHLEKIFEIFHRLNPNLSQGEGLGLTIAQRIIKRHNGTITVKSEPGEGTCFTLELPAPPPSAS